MRWSVELSGNDVSLSSSAVPLPVTVSARWLRDHGEDPASFDSSTRQRRVDVLTGHPGTLTDARVEVIDGSEALVLEWQGEPARTWIPSTTLDAVFTPQPPTMAKAWRTADSVAFADLDTDDVLTSDGALTAWLSDLARHGVARLRGFDGTHEQAEAIARRIGYVRTTIFGGLWDLASDLDEHDDTAYSESFLAPHTDGTYSHDAPGLQMFCCTARSGTGGESIIVDGLALYDDLAADAPEAAEILRTVPIPAHYIEPGVELRASRPAFRIDSASGALRQISLNNYDRSPMTLPVEQMRAFYEAYGRLQRMADDPSRWLSIRLEAGDVLINDNWRVLHGRQAYTGERRFIGCYLNHEDFESRCRTLGIAI